jgi:hypothetical protein
VSYCGCAIRNSYAYSETIIGSWEENGKIPMNLDIRRVYVFSMISALICDDHSLVVCIENKFQDAVDIINKHDMKMCTSEQK